MRTGSGWDSNSGPVWRCSGYWPLSLILTNTDIGRRILTFCCSTVYGRCWTNIDVLLTNLDLCWRILTVCWWIYVCWQIWTFCCWIMTFCWRILTMFCWRILTFVDEYWQFVDEYWRFVDEYGRCFVDESWPLLTNIDSFLMNIDVLLSRHLFMFGRIGVWASH